VELGVKVEIKNMNSFRAVHRALEYEIARQSDILGRGGTLFQETRGWVEAQGATVSQRSKEYAHDYRYFPDPDLPPLVLDEAFVDGERRRLPELPAARIRRFVEAYGISAYDATVICDTREGADEYEVLAAAGVPAKLAANWYNGDVARIAHQTRTPLSRSGLGADGLAALLRLLDAGSISGTTAKELLEEMYLAGGDPAAVVAERGLAQISDDAQLVRLVEEAIAGEPQAVADYRAGKLQAFGRLVGHVKMATAGKADAQRVTALLKERLDA
jgi:aspartyl-tRNA(Asn)/glutamyl-tRNA(Gln) amidotransferase subunit B